MNSSAKNVFEKFTVVTQSIGVEPLPGFEISEDEDIPDDTAESDALTVSKLAPLEISDYINSLKAMAEHWYYSFFPYDSTTLTVDEKEWIDKLNRIGIPSSDTSIHRGVGMKNTDSIKARLRALATRANKPYDYILTHYFIESVLLRITKSRFAGDFVLKGGLLLHVLFDHRARATRDIDLLAQHINNTPENMTTIFREICSIEADDAVHYDQNSLTVESITQTAANSGFRVKVICSLDRSRSTLQL